MNLSLETFKTMSAAQADDFFTGLVPQRQKRELLLECTMLRGKAPPGCLRTVTMANIYYNTVVNITDPQAFFPLYWFRHRL